jgi:hypothetical protein
MLRQPTRTPLHGLRRTQPTFALNVVDVLAEGKRVLTEPGVNYEVNMMDGRGLHVGRVEYVFRDGDVVIARMTSDKAFPVTGRACWFNAKSYFLP